MAGKKRKAAAKKASASKSTRATKQAANKKKETDAKFNDVWAQIADRTPYVDPDECSDSEMGDSEEDEDESMYAMNPPYDYRLENGKYIFVESSYTEKRLKTANLKRQRFIYDFCSSRELKSFVQKRGLKDPFPGGNTLSYFYRRTLETADKHPAPFRLMDLAVEIRMLIYEQALQLPDDDCPCGQLHGSCTPALLGASRQVNDEAKDILYGKNTIKCAFKVQLHGDIVHRKATVHRTVVPNSAHSEAPHAEEWNRTFEVYPEFFRRVQSLEIRLHVCDCHGHGTEEAASNSFEVMSSFLMTLSSFLMDGHTLKKLRVNLISSADVNEHEFESDFDTVFYPLRRLRDIGMVEISFDDHSETDWSEKINNVVAEMRLPDQPFNTVKWYHLLKNEAHTYSQLAHLLTPESAGYEAGDELLHITRADDADMVIDEISEIVWEGVHNKKDETKVYHKLAKLRDVLNEMSTAELRKKVDALILARRTTRQYTVDHPARLPVKYKRPEVKRRGFREMGDDDPINYDFF